MRFRSLVPFIAALVFLILARLSDVAIQLPPALQQFAFGIDHQRLNSVSDVADTAGVFLLVLGFVQTIKYLREKEKRIENLESLLPMCAWCKSIRGEDGRWERIEQYLLRDRKQRLTHGICPTCKDEFQQKTRERIAAKKS